MQPKILTQSEASSPIQNLFMFSLFVLADVGSGTQQLHRQGARRIAVLGMPPIGCVPSQRRSVAVDAAGGGRECDAAQNRAARLFNAKLEQEIGCLRETLQLQSIGYVDIYGVLDDMIADPGKYGDPDSIDSLFCFKNTLSNSSIR